MSYDYRKKLFDEYLETSYKQGNILSLKQFQMACDAFAIDYQEIMPKDLDSVILDFGCGVGHFLYFLKQKGYRNFYGVDISAQQVDYCRKNITDKVQEINGIDFLKSNNNRYDLITAHDVLEHISKDHVLEFLTVSFLGLKSNGTLILRVPNMSNPFGLDARYNDLTHENGFTSKSLKQALEIAGFNDVRILGPRRIPIRSFRNFIRQILVNMLHASLRFCFYIQDYTVPDNLDKNLVVIAKKT